MLLSRIAAKFAISSSGGKLRDQVVEAAQQLGNARGEGLDAFTRCNGLVQLDHRSRRR